MQKIITDKKPFVVERSETIELSQEIYVLADNKIWELFAELADKRQVPAGIDAAEKRMETRTGLIIWKYVWYEVQL